MSCYYILNGKTFNSELELDSFLIEKGDYFTKYGDIVFSKTVGKLHAEELIEDVNKEVEKNEALKRAYFEAKRIYDDDGKSIELPDPYIGVNRFLAEYTRIDDVTGESKKLFPTFQEEEYWSRRYVAWSKGGAENYTKDEIDLFFGGNEEDCIKISDPTLQKEYRAKIEEKWENQCLFGDAVHSAMELLFSKESDSYIKDLIKSGTFTKEQFREKLNKESYKKKNGEKVKFQDLIDGRLFDEVWNKCQNIAQQISDKYGEGCDFYPEFKITGKVSGSGDKVHTVLGIIDLLIIDKNGIPHIIDYKTSPKEYNDYNFVKKQTFKYQLAVYGKLLEKAGFAIDESKYSIVPIRFTDFQKNALDKYTCSGIKLREGGIFEDISSDVKTNEKIRDNLDVIMGTFTTPEITTEDLLVNVNSSMKKCFPQYRQIKKYEDEEIQKDVDEAKYNDESGQWEWIPEGSFGKSIKADSKIDLFKKIKKYREKLPKYLTDITSTVTSSIEEAFEAGTTDGITFTKTYYQDETVSPDWFKTTIKRYCNGNWKVRKDCKALKQLGIILLENIETHQFDVIKLSTNKLKSQYNFANKNTTNLLGSFKPDIYYQSRQKSLMLQGVRGNIELMETMFAINQLQGIFGSRGIVGQVQVMDPLHGMGLGASNKELEYCFNELYKNAEITEVPNNFNSGKIPMATKAYVGKTMFTDILRSAGDSYEGKYKIYKGFNEAKSLLDKAITLNDEKQQLKALQKLAKMLEEGDESGELKNGVVTNHAKMSEEHIQIYNQVLLAIAELKNIDLRQQISDHEKGPQSWKIFKNGLHGTYIDNPGNLQSETLNMLTKLVTEAYQNVRDDMVDAEAETRKLVENLKKKKGFSGLKEHTVGNQADLYKNIYHIVRDGEGKPVDILFKNPDTDTTMTAEEKAFVKHALNKINENRFLDDAEREHMRTTNDKRYYRVPLARGDSSSFASSKGLLKAGKERLSRWTFKGAIDEARAKALGIFNSVDEEKLKNQSKLFEMNNMFDSGESENRTQYIIDKGVEYFESNLETLLLKHQFAFSMKKHIDNVMPLIKASVIHLTTQGYQQNVEFTQDLSYAENYIRSKIKNEDIVNPKYRNFNALANKIKKAASTMVLAISPVQAIYQTIQGVWNDISLILRKPDGTMTFTLNNMLAAAKLVYSDMFHRGNKPTISQLLNQLYGINDMDINTYIDKIKSDQHGLYNFNNFLFKFAQRPDFYNRMTIFQTKMIADGCMDAHSINKDGVLVYDWKKDKRYEAFANGRKSDPKYNEQAAAYYAAAKQFESEHAKVKIDGKYVDFEVDMNNPMPLPRAYTNLEAESMKSLSDNIYGYYSHEKKSLIHSTVLGSLWMQFKTFWSGKKNQYLAGGGVRLEGQWKQYEENGQKYYYQVDPDGTVRYDLEPTTEETNAPLLRWEGQWQEGIMVTLGNLCSGRQSFHDMWYNEDENLRNTYRSNMYKLAYDLAMWIIIGSIISAALAGAYKEEKKKAGDSFLDGLRLSALNIGIRSVQNSFTDFNFVDSILSPATTWTPFSFEYVAKQLNGLASVALGNKSLWDYSVGSTSVGTQFKPLFDRIKPSSD